MEGKVTGPDGKPVVGASVSVKGTNVGTSTSPEGTYSIVMPPNANILIFTYVGYEVSEVNVTGTSVDVVLKNQTTNLNEVVVTGYSTQRKKDIIGAVSVVSAKDLQNTPSSNLAVQLQGRAAGVTVSSSGEPGAGAVVRIRGFASAGNNNPLYIIDGVPTDDPSKINPNDIESLQVLKDASAASIYGSRASNGVIIITTKQGKPGRSSLSYDSYVATQIVTDKMMPDMLNTAQYMDYLQKTTGATYTHPVFGA
ncbi:MAG: TonB-dependent receptor plug domain-containing protein, partial [Bacteroidota bacterium]